MNIYIYCPYWLMIWLQCRTSECANLGRSCSDNFLIIGDFCVCISIHVDCSNWSCGYTVDSGEDGTFRVFHGHFGGWSAGGMMCCFIARWVRSLVTILIVITWSEGVPINGLINRVTLGWVKTPINGEKFTILYNSFFGPTLRGS